MKKNVGTIDRVFRILLGLALIAMAVTNTAPVGAWGWIGLVPLLTGFVSFCPLYSLLGIKTRCKDDSCATG